MSGILLVNFSSRGSGSRTIAAPWAGILVSSFMPFLNWEIWYRGVGDKLGFRDEEDARARRLACLGAVYVP